MKTRVLLAVLVLGLALPARAEVPPATEGRLVDLEAGAPAPFKGALVDEAYARVLLERRRTAEEAADIAVARASSCAGELAECRAGSGTLSTSTVVALVAAAAAVGLLGGVYLGVTVTR